MKVAFICTSLTLNLRITLAATKCFSSIAEKNFLCCQSPADFSFSPGALKYLNTTFILYHQNLVRKYQIVTCDSCRWTTIVSMDDVAFSDKCWCRLVMPTI